jgi:pimeloyl-ACP methyl ester carboxylesterase
MRMIPVLTFPGRKTVTSLLRFLTPPHLPVPEYLVEERIIVYKTFRQSWRRPPMLTDDDLRQIGTPTLLLYGEQESIYNLTAIRERSARLPTNFRVDMIPDAGRVLDYDQPEVVSARIEKFIRSGRDERCMTF